MARRKPLGSARGKPWFESLFERDYYDIFSQHGPRGPLTPEQQAEQAEAEVDFVVEALGLPDGARVLDLCCGHGRHAVELARRGYRVSGLDLSAYHLRLAKAAAKRAGVEVEWLHSDMRSIPGRGGRFDAVVNMFTSFGYFDSEDEDERVLAGVARALKPGGRFLIDTMNRDWLMGVFRESDATELPDGGLIVSRRTFDVRTGRIANTWTHIAPDGAQREHSFSHRLYAYTELAAMLERAGLAITRTWGGFDGSELTRHSRRVIALAERR